MNKWSLSDEKHVDELLSDLGRQGLLDIELSDVDLDWYLATIPAVPVSDAFIQRALGAMREAQTKREERNPAIALGSLVSRARQRAGLEIEEVSSTVGISAKLLEALELGQLSARQILRLFPPELAVRLLLAINIAVNSFSDQLKELGDTAKKTFGPSSSKLAYQRNQEELTLTMDIAKYVKTIERIVRNE